MVSCVQAAVYGLDRVHLEFDLDNHIRRTGVRSRMIETLGSQ
jgi:hypothetical protein